MDLKKISAYALITLVILNLVLYGAGAYSLITFWTIIAAAGVIAYLFYRN